MRVRLSAGNCAARKWSRRWCRASRGTTKLAVLVGISGRGAVALVEPEKSRHHQQRHARHLGKRERAIKKETAARIAAEKLKEEGGDGVEHQVAGENLSGETPALPQQHQQPEDHR